jgi:hypothetical protein
MILPKLVFSARAISLAAIKVSQSRSMVVRMAGLIFGHIQCDLNAS